MHTHAYVSFHVPFESLGSGEVEVVTLLGQSYAFESRVQGLSRTCYSYPRLGQLSCQCIDYTVYLLFRPQSTSWVLQDLHYTCTQAQHGQLVSQYAHLFRHTLP